MSCNAPHLRTSYQQTVSCSSSGNFLLVQFSTSMAQVFQYILKTNLYLSMSISVSANYCQEWKYLAPTICKHTNRELLKQHLWIGKARFTTFYRFAFHSASVFSLEVDKTKQSKTDMGKLQVLCLILRSVSLGNTLWWIVTFIIYLSECHQYLLDFYKKKKVFLQTLPDTENIIQLSHWKQT